MSNTGPDRENGVDLYAIIADHKSTAYSVEQRLSVVMQYIVHGNLKEVSRQTGIPYMTIIDWKHKTEWWGAAVSECRKRKQDELDGTLTGMIDNTLQALNDRIANGDSKLDKGDIIKVPMQGKELATVAGILFDKRAALRGDPTSIQRNVSSAEQLQQLENKFAEFVKRTDANGAFAKPIEGEKLDGNENIRGQAEESETEDSE